jgi:RNA polymerase sigma-70 factor (ECF subfamily)
MTAYEDYLPALKTFFAARAPEPNAIDDLVQTVYERLLKYAPDETLRDPTAYIFKIALNVLSDANRHARADRQMTVNCDPSELEQYVNDQGNVLRTDNSADVLDNQLEMRRAFERLPRETQVAWLYSRDGYSYKQIAAKMNISEHTVKKFIAAALKHFREHFGATTTAR